MSEEWNDPPESEGITRGPEEALEREIARSKALKVERLQLRDQLETLQNEVHRLEEENDTLRRQLDAAQPPPSRQETPSSQPAQTGTGQPHPAGTPRPMVPQSWALALLAFNLAALGVLLILLVQC